MVWTLFSVVRTSPGCNRPLAILRLVSISTAMTANTPATIKPIGAASWTFTPAVGEPILLSTVFWPLFWALFTPTDACPPALTPLESCPDCQSSPSPGTGAGSGSGVGLGVGSSSSSDEWVPLAHCAYSVVSESMLSPASYSWPPPAGQTF